MNTLMDHVLYMSIVFRDWRNRSAKSDGTAAHGEGKEWRENIGWKYVEALNCQRQIARIIKLQLSWAITIW